MINQISRIIIFVLTVACATLSYYCLRINKSCSKITKQDNETIQTLKEQLQVEKGIKTDREKEECLTFLKDYAHILELIKSRERNIYLKLIEEDKAILVEISKLQNDKPANTESRRLIENRFTQMLRSEIDWCDFSIKKIDTDAIPVHEYDWMMKTYPHAIFQAFTPHPELDDDDSFGVGSVVRINAQNGGGQRVKISVLYPDGSLVGHSTTTGATFSFKPEDVIEID